MESLVWIGTVVALAGLAGLIWCIVHVLRLRRSGLPDEQMRAAMQRAVGINFAALAVSTLGLMLVVLGVFLS